MTEQVSGIGTTCRQCGGTTWRAGEDKHTVKRRPKFGFLWLVLTLVTAGLGFFVWLVWPRHKVTTSVDRWMQCQGCGAKVGA